MTTVSLPNRSPDLKFEPLCLFSMEYIIKKSKAQKTGPANIDEMKSLELLQFLTKLPLETRMETMFTDNACTIH